MPVASIDNPTDYEFWAWGVGNPVSGPMFDTYGALGGIATDDSELAQARRVTRQTDGVRRALASLVGHGISSRATYPTGDAFPEQLAALAEMLEVGLPIRCVAITGAGGYDTHAGQAATLASNIQTTADSLVDFQQDIEARGIADRVHIHVWSEFGRRVAENGGGTDHGAAGAAFLIGTNVQRQVVGEFPGLASLDSRGNLLHTSDFRVIYTGLLDQWLGADPGPIIPGADNMVVPALLAA